MSGQFLFSDGCEDSWSCCYPFAYTWNYSQSPPVRGSGKFPDGPQSDWIAFAASPYMFYGIRSDGSLWGWSHPLAQGGSPLPTLGHGDTSLFTVPRLIDEGPWQSISTYSGYEYPTAFTLGLKQDGTLWAWGDNSLGQLGNGLYGGIAQGEITESGLYSSVGFSCKGRARISTSVQRVEIQQGGEYRRRPTVSFVVQSVPCPYFGNERGLTDNSEYNPENASGAAGEAVMSFKLRGCTVANAGSGYTSVPTATVVSSETVAMPSRISVWGSFSIASVEVVDGGGGYTGQPTLTPSGLSGGSGFEYECFIEGGKIVSVDVTSPGSGYRTPDTKETFFVNVTGGGGGGAVLKARLRDGFIYSADPSVAGSGYQEVPTIAVTGGGGQGGQITGDWRGSVVKVNVTNGGGGYTEIDQTYSGGTGTSGVYPCRYVNVAFDRDSEDDLTRSATAKARLTPVSVSEVTLLSGHDFNQPYFNERTGELLEFTLTNVHAGGWNTNDPPTLMPDIEARIVGDGLTWDTGESLEVTHQDTVTPPSGITPGTTVRRFSAHYSPTGRQYGCRPKVVVLKKEPAFNLKPESMPTLTTRTIAGGLDVDAQLYATRPAHTTTPMNVWIKPLAGTRLAGGAILCSTTVCAVINQASIDTFDIVGYYNGIGGQLDDRPILLEGGLTGAPQATAGAGGGEISLTANFDGTCYYSISDRGDAYRQVFTKERSDSFYNYACLTKGEYISKYTVSYTSFTIHEVPDTWRPQVTLSSYTVSQKESYSTVSVPDAAWRGPHRPRRDSVYCSFGSSRSDSYVRRGCWKLLREGSPETILAGDEYDHEPLVTVYPYALLAMEQIPGSWRHAEAGVSTVVNNASYRACAINTAGELYVWGGGDEALIASDASFVFPTHRGSLPQPIGKVAVITCNWNADVYPHDGTYPATASSYVVEQKFSGDSFNRFDVVDPPQFTSGSQPADIKSSRHCTGWKFYPDEVYNDAFLSFGMTDDVGLSASTWVGTSGLGVVTNDFTGNASTSWTGGFGYTSPPLVHFRKIGNPLLSVSASLQSLPPFSKVLGSYAITTDQKLWSLANGWVSRGVGYTLASRQATFSASPVIDSWIVKADLSASGYRFESMSPEEACGVPNGWMHCNTYRSAGDVSFDGRCSQAKSAVTHETIESISVVRHYAIVFDDGGSGFDDYSTWRVKVTPPPVVSLTADSGVTKVSGSYLVEPGYFMENSYTQALAGYGAQLQFHKACSADPNAPFPPPDPEMFQIESKTLAIKSSLTHTRSSQIVREPAGVFYIRCKTWRGSCFPTAGLEGYGHYYTRRVADTATLDDPANAYFIDGPFESGQEPTIEFECLSGESSYTSPPSYRIIAIAGSLRRSNGPAEMNGSWTDFDTESSDRKIAKAPFKDAKGLKAPEDENHFVKIVNGIGLKEDGSLWKLGWMNSPSVVTGHLEYTVSSAGSGYASPVTAEITTQPNGVATATATFDGRLVAVGVVSGGSGYRTPPTLTIEGGASATAVIEGPVDAVTVTNGGSGYKTPPRVRFSQPGFSAFAKAKLAGSISEIVVVEGGGSYTSAPDVQILGTGSGAAATAVISGRVSEIVLSRAGSGYASPPTVTIVGGGGSGATAVAVMKKAGATYAVKSVKITSGGSGYSSSPSVSFSGGGGRGAGAFAQISAKVVSISVDSGGDGYEDDATVAISGDAKAIARLDLSVSSVSVTHGGAYRVAPTVTFESRKSIASIAINSGGTGYTSAPDVLIAGGVGSGAEAVATIDAAVASVTVLERGAGYSQSSPPEVRFSGGCTESAEGTAIVGFGGQITGIQITNRGSGYTTPPTVSLVGQGSGARLAAVLDGSVSAVTLTKFGFGYDGDAPPTVMFVGGGGSGAAATATIEQAGSGATANATIDGSVIYATVTGPGSMLQKNPAVTASTSQNAKVQELQQLLSNGQITQEQFDDRSSEYVAVLQAGIEGLVTSTTITDAGEHYAYTSNSNSTFDRHGKRLSREVEFVGSSSYASGSRSVLAEISTDAGGGGSITSVPNPTQKFCGRPAVVFSNTYSAKIFTRLAVSSLAIKTGGTLATQPRAIIQNSIDVVNAESISLHALGVLDPRGAENATCVRLTRYGGITPYRFLDSSGLAGSRPYARAPQFTVESLTAGGATSAIALNGDGFIVDPDTNERPPYNKPLEVTSTASNYSSGLVGRTTTPGLALFTPPTLTLTVTNGVVTAVQKSDDGNLSAYATNPAFASYFVSVVVHGGGGSGAKVQFNESGVPYVRSGGSGYTSTPTATVIANIEQVYGKEHSLDESEWPTWTPVMSSSSTCVAEYVSGSTDGEYVTLQGDVPVTEDGVYPMFQDGFVPYASPSQGSQAAFIKHFSEDPQVTLIRDDCDSEATVEAKIVRWSSTFHSDGTAIIAQREED